MIINIISLKCKSYLNGILIYRFYLFALLIRFIKSVFKIQEKKFFVLKYNLILYFLSFCCCCLHVVMYINYFIGSWTK